MICVECDQYSDEWWDNRLGNPTSSMFKKLVTSTGKKSQSAKGQAFKLAAELKRNKRDESFQSDWTDRGSELEPEAVETYGDIMGVEVRQVGLVYQDERRLWSCSPDGLPPKGGLEVKCPSPGVHMQYLFENKVPTIYKPQVYGSLWICDECEWWDFFSYHPDMDFFKIRTTREDPEYQQYAAALEKYLPPFVALVREIAG